MPPIQTYKLLCPNCSDDQFVPCDHTKTLDQLSDEDHVICTGCSSIWRVDYLCIVPLEE